MKQSYITGLKTKGSIQWQRNLNETEVLSFDSEQKFVLEHMSGGVERYVEP
jgi:hypothetical protein